MHLSRRASRASLGGGSCGSGVRMLCKYAAKVQSGKCAKGVK